MGVGSTAERSRVVATGTDVRMARLADALSVPDSGFSIMGRTGREVTGGYAVAVHPDAEQQIGGTVTGADLTAYAHTNAALLVRPGAVFGAWRDPRTGVAYLDVSQVVDTRAEAVALAQRHNQLAYFDFARGESVAL